MVRIGLVILALFGLLWMMVPVSIDEMTEIGFAPGSPDPNVYTTTYEFGAPLVWGSWERSRNAAAGYDELKFASLHPLPLVAHLIAIAAPLLLCAGAASPWKRRPLTPA